MKSPNYDICFTHKTPEHIKTLNIALNIFYTNMLLEQRTIDKNHRKGIRELLDNTEDLLNELNEQYGWLLVEKQEQED